MTEVLAWQRGTSSEDVLRRAVQALREGRLVAFPMDTGYGIAASALVPDAVGRLGPTNDAPLTLAIRGTAEALDWVPAMSPLGRRLARRCWPGPVTLVFGEGAERGLAGRLPERVRQRVCPTGALRCRVPAHDAILGALDRLAGPVVFPSTSRATTAEQVVAAASEDVAIVINDGPSRYDPQPTVVQVAGNLWRVLSEGVVPAAEVERLSPALIVFVCTGNTCRSPLAEALCKKLLAERIGCPIEDLPRRGFVVHSAGLAAMMGGTAAAEAVEAARDLGADLSGHVSRPLSARVVAEADYLVAMTRSHLLGLAQQFPRLGPEPRLLSGTGDDLADPVGGDRQVYRDCAQQILRDLEGLLAELHPS